MRVGHGSGERQLTKILQYLLAASNPNPSLDHFGIQSLVRIVFENCSRRFPHLFDEQFNIAPVRMRLLGGGRSDAERRLLAVVLEHLLDLEPGMSTRLQFDNQAMAEACMQYADRFVLVSNATSISFDKPWIDPGRWRTASHGGTKMLCSNLVDACARARDNELFVLVAPEPIDQESLELIESSVKTVVAAKHRVIFIAPTIPSPNNMIHDPVAARILARENRVDLTHADSELKWRLAALGAAFARLEDPSLMQIIAGQIGLLQSGKSRGRAVGVRG